MCSVKVFVVHPNFITVTHRVEWQDNGRDQYVILSYEGMSAEEVLRTRRNTLKVELSIPKTYAKQQNKR